MLRTVTLLVVGLLSAMANGEDVEKPTQMFGVHERTIFEVGGEKLVAPAYVSVDMAGTIRVWSMFNGDWWNVSRTGELKDSGSGLRSPIESVDLRQLQAQAPDLRSFGGFASDHAKVLSRWVSDPDSHAVHYFPWGRERVRFGGMGSFPGALHTPRGLDYLGDASHGRVFVADSRNHRICEFDAFTGEFIGMWGGHAIRPLEHHGKLETPYDIAIAPDGSFAVVCEPWEDRIQIFRPLADGEEPPSMGAVTQRGQELAAGGSTTHFGPRIDAGRDTLIVWDPDTQRVSVMDTRGEAPVAVTRFGGHAAKDLGDIKAGRFLRIVDVAYDDERDEVWVLDGGTNRLSRWRLERDRDGEKKFDPFMAKLVESMDVPGLLRSLDLSMFDLDWDLESVEGRAIVIDGGEASLAVGGTERVYTLTWGIETRKVYRHGGANVPPEAAYDFDRFGGVGAPSMSDGYVALLRTPSAEIISVRTRFGLHHVSRQKLKDEASSVDIGKMGMGAGEFRYPMGVAATDRGTFYVVDFANHRIQELDLEGNMVSVFGNRFFVAPALDDRREANRNED
ncbi:MAG: hypothetical protein AAGD00_03235 [Planctomycetota bacterium]